MESWLVVTFLWINFAQGATLEFYWLTISKLPVGTLRDLLVNELQTYCNLTGDPQTKCDISTNGVLDSNSIVLGEPTQSGHNVAIDVDGQYSADGTFHPIADSHITGMLDSSEVRERVSDGTGSWLEMVNDTRYYIQANNVYNITISVSMVTVVLILLIITVILRKRAIEQEKREHDKISKTRTQDGKSVVQRRGAEGDLVTTVLTPHPDVDLAKMYNSSKRSSREENDGPLPIHPEESGSQISVISSTVSKRLKSKNKNRIENKSWIENGTV